MLNNKIPNGIVSSVKLELKTFYENFPYKNLPFDQKPFALTIKNGFSCYNKIINNDGKEVKFIPEIYYDWYKKRVISKEPKNFNKKNIKHFKGTVITFIKAFPNNYFHWLMDIFPTFNIIDLLNIKEKVKIHLDLNKQYKKEHIKHLGYSSGDVIDYRKYPCISADKLIFIYVGSRYYDWSKNYIRNSLINCCKRKRNNRRIYISRSDSPTYPQGGNMTTRKVQNEDELIKFLKTYGFEVYTLSGKSLKEQVRLFSESNVMIMPHGAGMINNHFCSSKTMIIQLWSPLSWKSPAHQSPVQYKTYNNNVRIVNFMGKDYNTLEINGNMIIDIKKLERFFKIIGIHK
ncbi:glycosyltransferase family 61 protein [Candidatus Pacearchaeota archaeon]|nr:glycosyltransferase family 61 protein [Candidatus Pacearchaeota archaeon]